MLPSSASTMIFLETFRKWCSCGDCADEIDWASQGAKLATALGERVRGVPARFAVQLTSRRSYREHTTQDPLRN